MIKKLTLTLLIAIGFTAFAEAQTRTPVATSKQIKQHKRIAQGNASGSLTRKETRQLKTEQRHIQRTKKRMKSDGKITKKERAILNQKQKRANRNIRRKKHNAITK